MKPLIFLDVEATGVETEDRLCSIAFKVDNNLFSEIVKPPLPVKLIAMSINNITNEMTADKLPFQETQAYRYLKSIEQTHILVSHNVQYDADMLKKEGVEFTESICTLKLAHYIDVDCKFEKHNLSYLRYYYKINVDAKAHDAAGDVLILEQVYKKLSEGFEQSELVTISSKPTLYRRFPFGKFTGQLIKDVANDTAPKGGRSWMQWLLGEKVSNPQENDADWIYTLNYYLNAYEPTNK